jgi:calcium/calmodulin-dependent protein kinase I
MSKEKETLQIPGEVSKEFHLSKKIRRRPLSGPPLSRSPSIPALSRSPSYSGRMGVSELLSRTSSLAGKISSFLPSLHSFSRNSSDSGVFSIKTSRPPSTPVSRRSSIFSFSSQTSAETESDDELLSHVNVVPGGDVTDTYDLKQLLGEGAFSKVYLAESKSDAGGLAAVKIIDKEELCKEEDKMFLVDKEIEIMSQLDHPNIVRLFEVYENRKEVCLVMELAKGGELFDKLLEQGCLPEVEAGRLMTQVLEAVYDLHSRGIVHRDLKPENLLFYDNQASSKLLVVDFGLSEYEEELNKDSPVCGTATYLAPEVIAQEESNRGQDMWSCGVITYILLCGYPPFFKDSEEKSETALLRQIVRGKYKFHANFWDHISEEGRNFVSRLMCPDPRLRITVEEALNHPWIVKCNKQNYKESAAFIFLQSFLIFVTICAIFSLYFFILSGYFDIESHFLCWLWEAGSSMHSCIQHAGSKSSNICSQFLNYFHSESLASYFEGIQTEL